MLLDYLIIKMGVKFSYFSLLIGFYIFFFVFFFENFYTDSINISTIESLDGSNVPKESCSPDGREFAAAAFLYGFYFSMA